MAPEENIRNQGTEQQYAPRLVGEILHDNLENSNEPMYAAYRKYKKDANECVLFQDLFPNTELGVDLKLFTRQMGRMAIGEYLAGTIKRDGDYHYTFVENDNNVGTRVHRNPIIFSGKCINLHRRDDGTVYLRFTRPEFTPEFTFRDFCIKAVEEILTVSGS